MAYIPSCYSSLFYKPTTLGNDQYIVSDPTNETDRLALLKFKELIANDPHKILSSWNDSIHFCNWHGVTCSHQHQRVAALNLQGYTLHGSISPYVGNFSFLKLVNLRDNNL